MKKLLRLLQVVLLLAFYGCQECRCPAANVVFGGFTDKNGTPMNRTVGLTLLNQPLFNGVGLTYDATGTYPMTNFTVTVSNLAGGNYALSLAGLNRILGLAVPNDTNTYQFMQLVTNQLPTLSTTHIGYAFDTNFFVVVSNVVTLSTNYPTFAQGDTRWDPLGSVPSSMVTNWSDATLDSLSVANTNLLNVVGYYGGCPPYFTWNGSAYIYPYGAILTNNGSYWILYITAYPDVICASNSTLIGTYTPTVPPYYSTVVSYYAPTVLNNAGDVSASGVFIGNGSRLTYTNANGAKFTVLVNPTTNGFILVPAP